MLSPSQTNLNYSIAGLTIITKREVSYSDRENNFKEWRTKMKKEYKNQCAYYEEKDEKDYTGRTTIGTSYICNRKKEHLNIYNRKDCLKCKCPLGYKYEIKEDEIGVEIGYKFKVPSVFGEAEEYEIRAIVDEVYYVLKNIRTGRYTIEHRSYFVVGIGKARY